MKKRQRKKNRKKREVKFKYYMSIMAKASVLAMSKAIKMQIASQLLNKAPGGIVPGTDFTGEIVHVKPGSFVRDAITEEIIIKLNKSIKDQGVIIINEKTDVSGRD